MRNHPGAFFLPGLLCFLIAVHSSTVSASEEQQHRCRYCDAAGAPVSNALESSKYLKYTPDKRFEIRHLALDLTPDFARRTVSGSVVLNFKPIGTPLDEIRLNAVDMTVNGASSSQKEFKYQVTGEEIVFTFSPPVGVGKEARVSVDYCAEPIRGLYFRTREMGYAATQLWTQGEAIESRHWFPCVDHPLTKFTTEVTCHLPAGMVALSNGKQISAETDDKGLTALQSVFAFELALPDDLPAQHIGSRVHVRFAHQIGRAHV